MDSLKKKWQWTVTVAWLVAVASILIAVYLGFKFGVYEAPGRDEARNVVMVTKVNMGVIFGCVVQVAASVLFAVMFMMINEVYENSIDIYEQNQILIRNR